MARRRDDVMSVDPGLQYNMYNIIICTAGTMEPEKKCRHS